MSGGLGRGQIHALREGQGPDLEATKALGGVRGEGMLKSWQHYQSWHFSKRGTRYDAPPDMMQ